ncbi:hypothetical protein BH09PSE4_BH09PSE4_04170 [soil metagenome]
MSGLQTVKFWLVHHVGLAKDALHIYVALILFLGSAMLFKWGLKSWKPWAVVLAAALLGEAWDVRDTIAYGQPVHLWANWHDIWNTMFWPSVLMLLARYSALFRLSDGFEKPFE